MDECLTPINEEIKPIYEKCKNKVVVGFGLGIPSLSDHETKYARYVLNKIAIQQIFEGEDDWDANDAEDVGD